MRQTDSGEAGQRSARPRRGRVAGGVAIVLVAVATAWGQDLGVAELRRMYDDVVAQLKLAQERKLELAAENERLLAEREKLQAELHAAEAGRQRLLEEGRLLRQRLELAEATAAAAESEAAAMAQRTWQARSMWAAWEGFLAAHPDVRREWHRFVQWSSEDGDALMWWYDRGWPLEGTGRRSDAREDADAEQSNADAGSDVESAAGPGLGDRDGVAGADGGDVDDGGRLCGDDGR
ncbi:MAG: hypothetical protein ACK4PI_11115 [Tepidisphaerales bacterium]